MSITHSFISMLLNGLSKQSWCFTHGAFVLSNGDIIFKILKDDGNAYKRISTHQKRFVLNNKTNLTQYGYDFNPISLSCGNGKKVVYRTVLFFKLPKNRIYVKFEEFGTRSAYDLIFHGIDLVRTRFEKPRNNFRKEKLRPFSKNFPNNWNQNQNATNYHKNRVGREVFLSNSSLLKVLESGTNVKKNTNRSHIY